jgi:cyclophilin family peptidyl-prolyl cis-trans isomerase/HEAT repeat protein
MAAPMSRPLATLLGALLAPLLVACGPPAPPATAPDLPVLAVPDLETRALLLYQVDRQTYEPFVAEQALRGGPELREALAVALGRIPDRRGLPILAGLLLDEAASVRRAAAFGLGELEDPEGAPALAAAVADADRETGTLAVEALGKLGVSVIEAADRLAALPDAERWARLLPSLFRFRQPEMVPLAQAGLAVEDPELHARAAYALAREPFPEAAPALRRLLADPDPRVRAWAARGVGIVGAAEDLAALRPLLDDPEPGPAVQALRAGRKLVDDGKAETAPEDWRPALARLVDDPRPGVRTTALEAAAAWPLAGEADLLAAKVADRGEKGTGRERGVAVVAAAAGGHPRAAELARQAAGAGDADVRARAAEAAALLLDRALLDRLWKDPKAEVRTAALGARLALIPAGEEGDDEARAALQSLLGSALADADSGVRAVALDALGGRPVLPLDDLQEALARTLRNPSEETALGAVGAVAARAKAEPRERGGLIALLEKVAQEGAYTVRRAAGDALADLGRPRPPLAPVQVAETGRAPAAYREILQRTWRPRTVEIRTAKGPLRVRLACPQAPLTCLNFLQLAAQGYYDGIVFHRVVADFVIQGGDPRGDGFGGPGYSIRDEINRLRYVRGTMGMALAGPDTGGSQFFIAHSPQPHLDGGYTVFGQLISGFEVLDRIVADDRIETIVEVGEGSR